MGTWKHTSGTWSLVAITAEKDVNLGKTAWIRAWRGRRFARVEALAMASVEICSRKKGKANRPSESEKILLGHYIRLDPGSQESCVYLGAKWLRRGKQINRNLWIKSLLSQNYGARVYTKIWREKREDSKLPKSCQSRNRLHKDRYQLIQIRLWNRISLDDVSR